MEDKQETKPVSKNLIKTVKTTFENSDSKNTPLEISKDKEKCLKFLRQSLSYHYKATKHRIKSILDNNKDKDDIQEKCHYCILLLKSNSRNCENLINHFESLEHASFEGYQTSKIFITSTLNILAQGLNESLRGIVGVDEWAETCHIDTVSFETYIVPDNVI